MERQERQEMERRMERRLLEIERSLERWKE
jgi:hypothetical protein